MAFVIKLFETNCSEDYLGPHFEAAGPHFEALGAATLGATSSAASVTASVAELAALLACSLQEATRATNAPSAIVYIVLVIPISNLE